MAKIGKLFLDFEAGTAKFNGPLRKAKKELSLFARATLTANKGFKGFNQGLGMMAIKAAAVAVVLRSVGRAMKGAVSPAADLEESLNRVSGIMNGLDGKTFDRIKEKARLLGRTTEFTAGQAADGFRFLAMAGLDADEALAAITPSLHLASAGGIELAESADLVTNIMGQMGLGFGETSRAVDVLAKTASSSNTDVLEMAEAFKFAGPTARALGVDIEETAAVIGTLANAGLKAGIGTRALSTALAGLASAETGRKLQKALNIRAFTNEGDFIGIINLIGKMNDAFADMSAQARLGVISDVFGKNALQEMDVLLNAGVDSLREFEAALDGSTNAAQKMAETNLRGLNGQLKKLNSAFQDVLISLGEAGLLKLLTENAKRMTDFLAAVASSKVMFDFFTTAVERLRKGMTFLESVFKIFVLGLKGWKDILTFVFNQLVNIAVFVQTTFVIIFREAVGKIAQAWLFLSKIVQGSIGLISNAILFLLKSFGKLDGFLGLKVDVSGPIAEIERLKAAIDSVFDGFQADRQLVIDSVDLPITSIRKIAEDFGTGFANFIAGQKGKLDAAWSKLTEPLQENLLLAAGEGIGTFEENVAALASNQDLKKLKTFAGEFSKEWVKFGDSIQDVLVNGAVQMKSFGDIADDVLAKIRENIIKTVLLGQMDSAGNRGGGFLGSLFSSGTGGFLGGILGGIGGLFGGMFANGGQVSGAPIIVGERGPELFTPGGAGSITPNHRLGRSNGGSTTVNNYFDIRGSESEVQRMIANSVEVSVNMAIAQSQNLKNRGKIR